MPVEPYLGLTFLLVPFAVFFLICWLNKLDKKRHDANLNQGEEALRTGDLDLAFSCANEEIRREPKAPRGYRLRGQALHRKGVYIEAIESYCMAIELDAAMAIDDITGYLYRLRGDSFAALRQYDRAIADYSDAIRLNPADTKAVERRKVAYDERKALGDVPANNVPDRRAITADPSLVRDGSDGASFNELSLSAFVERLATVPPSIPPKSSTRSP
jgi:tetratricopeptide (TPR) repeat protein